MILIFDLSRLDCEVRAACFFLIGLIGIILVILAHYEKFFNMGEFIKPPLT